MVLSTFQKKNSVNNNIIGKHMFNYDQQCNISNKINTENILRGYNTDSAYNRTLTIPNTYNVNNQINMMYDSSLNEKKQQPLTVININNYNPAMIIKTRFNKEEELYKQNKMMLKNIKPIIQLNNDFKLNKTRSCQLNDFMSQQNYLRNSFLLEQEK